MVKLKVGDRVRRKIQFREPLLLDNVFVLEGGYGCVRNLVPLKAGTSWYIDAWTLNQQFELVPEKKQIRWLKVGDVVRRKSKRSDTEFKPCVVTDVTLAKVTLDGKEEVPTFGFVDQFESVSGDGLRVRIPNPLQENSTSEEIFSGNRVEKRAWRQASTETEQHVPGIPSGYVAIAWREYKAGELYLMTDNAVGGPAHKDQYSATGPYGERRSQGVKRLILKKVEPVKPTLPGVPDGYEAVRWGYPGKGDLFMHYDQQVALCHKSGQECRLIVRKVPPPVFNGKLAGIPDQQWLVKRWGVPAAGEHFVNVKGTLKVGPEAEGYHRLCVTPVKNEGDRLLRNFGWTPSQIASIWSHTLGKAAVSVVPGQALFVDKGQCLKLEHEWRNYNTNALKWVAEGGVMPLNSIRTGRTRLAAERDCEVEWQHKLTLVCGWFEAGTRPDGGWSKTGHLRKIPTKGPSPVGEAMKSVSTRPTEYEFQNRLDYRRQWFSSYDLPPHLYWTATGNSR